MASLVSTTTNLFLKIPTQLPKKTRNDTCTYWVSKLTKTSLTYIVGTKLDLVLKDPSKRQVDRDEAEALAAELGPECKVFETSSLSGL